ncbi:MAG TPA: PfkB family carbohydrate kinase [Dissulfurispiraceae bacterium]|nr:PfkB family carbohydrate kinase [Dissulfurispiraceae bacterium]
MPIEGIRVVPEEFTAGAYITTDRSDNQITGFNPGAMKFPSGFTFEGDGPEDTILLIAPGNLGDMQDYARTCRKRRIPYICDPGQSLTAWEREAFTEWIDGSELLISNDYELELIMTMTGRDKKGLLTLTGTIITTLGEKGSLISTRDGEFPVAAASVSTVVDPTGAGDAYRAGMLKGISMGKDIINSAKMGAVAATYAVEHYGTQEHAYTYAEFIARYRENFGD